VVLRPGSPARLTVDAEPIEETCGGDGDIIAEKVTNRLRQLELTRKQQGDRWLGDLPDLALDVIRDGIDPDWDEGVFDPTFQRGPDETQDAYKQRITAELLARLEGAGYVFSQKRDGSWWWSDREDEGAFEGNDTPLPSKALAIAGAWAHFCERNRATGDGDWIEAHEALMHPAVAEDQLEDGRVRRCLRGDVEPVVVHLPLLSAGTHRPCSWISTGGVQVSGGSSAKWW